MTESTIEERLANLERQVAELKQNQPVKSPWWERVGRVMDPAMIEADREFEPYQRYIRQTGELPPDSWKPGDPIPEPDWWEPDISNGTQP